MKTLIIWSDFEELPELYVVDGDYRHLDEIVINICDQDPAKEKELTELMYTDGYILHVPLDPKALGTCGGQFDYVIRCGFAP